MLITIVPFCLMVEHPLTTYVLEPGRANVDSSIEAQHFRLCSKAVRLEGVLRMWAQA
jgi:hypothetical protein